MSIYSENDLARLRRQLETDPAVQAGWATFVDRVRTIDEAKLEAWDGQRRLLIQRASEAGGNKWFSLGNFLRSAANFAP